MTPVVPKEFPMSANMLLLFESVLFLFDVFGFTTVTTTTTTTTTTTVITTTIDTTKNNVY